MKNPGRGKYSRFVVFVVGLFIGPLGGTWVVPGTTHASASVTFDGSPGTNPPPATLGPYTMTAFATDPQPLFSGVGSIAAPGGGTVSFAPSLYHLQVGNGWATWSNGYTGDVYWTFGATSAAVTLPLGTLAFYFYAEPNPFATFTITATTTDGTSSGPIPVAGFAGASYFGFYTDGTTSLQSRRMNAVVGWIGPYWRGFSEPMDGVVRGERLQMPRRAGERPTRRSARGPHGRRLKPLVEPAEGSRCVDRFAILRLATASASGRLPPSNGGWVSARTGELPARTVYEPTNRR